MKKWLGIFVFVGSFIWITQGHIDATDCPDPLSYIDNNQLCLGTGFGLSSVSLTSGTNQIKVLNNRFIQINGNYIMVFAPKDNEPAINIAATDTLTFVPGTNLSGIIGFIGHTRKSGLYIDNIGILYPQKRTATGTLSSSTLYIQDNGGPLLIGRSLQSFTLPSGATQTAVMPLVYISTALDNSTRVGIKTINPNAALDVNGVVRIARGYVKKERARMMTESTTETGTPSGFDPSITRVIQTKEYTVSTNETHQVLIIVNANLDPTITGTVDTRSGFIDPRTVTGLTRKQLGFLNASDNFFYDEGCSDCADEIHSGLHNDTSAADFNHPNVSGINVYDYGVSGNLQIKVDDATTSRVFSASFPWISYFWYQNDGDDTDAYGLEEADSQGNYISRLGTVGKFKGSATVSGILGITLTGGTHTIQVGVGMTSAFRATSNVTIVVIKKIQNNIQTTLPARTGYTPKLITAGSGTEETPEGRPITETAATFLEGSALGFGPNGVGMIGDENHPGILRFRSLVNTQYYAPLYAASISANSISKIEPLEIRETGDLMTFASTNFPSLVIRLDGGGTGIDSSFAKIPGINTAGTPYPNWNSFDRVSLNTQIQTKKNTLTDHFTSQFAIGGNVNLVNGGLILEGSSVQINKRATDSVLNSGVLNVRGDIRADRYEVGLGFVKNATISNLNSGSSAETTAITLPLGTYDISIIGMWRCTISNALQVDNPTTHDTYHAFATFSVGAVVSSVANQNYGNLTQVHPVRRYVFTMNNSLTLLDYSSQSLTIRATASEDGGGGYTCQNVEFTIFGVAK